MKKKIVISILCLTMALSATACGKSAETTGSADVPISTEQTAQTEEVITEDTESESVSTVETTETSDNPVTTIGDRVLTDEELNAIYEYYLANGTSSINVPYTENEDGTRDYSVDSVVVTDGIIAVEGNRNDILNNRPEAEKEEDAADGWVGITLSIDPDTGCSVGTDIVTGATYHIGDITSDGWVFSGDMEHNKNDAVKVYRMNNPGDTETTDEQIIGAYQGR